MPTFFKVIKRILSGQPAFTPDDEQAEDYDQADQPTEEANTERPDEPESSIVKGDARTFPAVIIKHCDCRVRGSEMELYCRISNESSMPIKLDRIRMFGSEERLEVDLHPHEERQVRVFEGPQRTSQNEREVRLDYKTESGDYFEATHDIRFTFQPDTKTYSVDEMHLRPPIRDIYG
jgi:hypothetical protein